MFAISALIAEKVVKRPDGRSDIFGEHTVVNASAFPFTESVVVVAVLQVEKADVGRTNNLSIHFVNSKGEESGPAVRLSMEVPKVDLPIRSGNAVANLEQPINIQANGPDEFLVLLKHEGVVRARIPYRVVGKPKP